jgi:hypothetical protein
LNSSRASDLAGAHIDGQHFSSGTNLFGEMEGWNTVSGCDIKNPQASAKI